MSVNRDCLTTLYRKKMSTLHYIHAFRHAYLSKFSKIFAN